MVCGLGLVMHDICHAGAISNSLAMRTGGRIYIPANPIRSKSTRPVFCSRRPLGRAETEPHSGAYIAPFLNTITGRVLAMISKS